MLKDYYRVSCIKIFMFYLICKMIFFNVFIFKNVIYYNVVMFKIFINLLIVNIDKTRFEVF